MSRAPYPGQTASRAEAPAPPSTRPLGRVPPCTMYTTPFISPRAYPGHPCRRHDRPPYSPRRLSGRVPPARHNGSCHELGPGAPCRRPLCTGYIGRCVRVAAAPLDGFAAGDDRRPDGEPEIRDKSKGRKEDSVLGTTLDLTCPSRQEDKYSVPTANRQPRPESYRQRRQGHDRRRRGGEVEMTAATPSL